MVTGHGRGGGELSSDNANALGRFLRSRRQQLDPDVLGLEDRQRRRTPGLRREEVAARAGVSTSWYTWLEQGRVLSPSVEVLDAVARALCLEEAARHYLFDLADLVAPIRHSDGSDSELEQMLSRLVGNLLPCPAYVTDAAWNLVAWNRSVSTALTAYELFEPERRNVMHMIFTTAHARRHLVDWEGEAHRFASQLRVDLGRDHHNPRLRALVERLLRESDAFREIWATQQANFFVPRLRTFEHRSAGRLVFEHFKLDVADASGYRVVVFVPSTDETRAKVVRLLNEDQPAHDVESIR